MKGKKNPIYKCESIPFTLNIEKLQIQIKKKKSKNKWVGNGKSSFGEIYS